MSAADSAVADTPSSHRVQRATATQLLLAFLGAFVLDRAGREHIHARVIIDLLDSLDINEGTTRVTLNRMVNNGLLDRRRAGRTMAYGLTKKAVEMLREGDQRVSSVDPFHRESTEWTLLSYSIPESRRDLRHRLRSQLLWSGFGRIRDGLWIAPGTVDVRSILDMLKVDDAVAFAFAGAPVDAQASRDIVAAAWDLHSLRAHHEAFIATWSGEAPAPPHPLAAHTAMVADWLELLRTDPGLPTKFLPTDWPAPRSVAAFQRATERQFPSAEQALERMIEQAAQRR
ncbi:PaaX family transcriptional regulator C-terminal domain-containing protein [Mycobacterium sp. 1245852.3]|uniref:PaaX family transcriptional regulator n=1 Tax=Mycobacterium sp. 1245852.3 TaxID=1856860 RepID=UPI000A488CDE|nr:PaaX family transcriptional regulator C-terminal domain-containing protein [Mycobacterium sp. 1245852.3]